MSSRVGSLRRASHSSSTASLRRSSISSRDIIHIQQALLRQRPISHHTVGVLLVFLPSFSFFLLHAIHDNAGLLGETLSSLCLRWPFALRALPPLFDPIAWKIVLVFLSVQLLLYEVLPRDRVAILNAGEVTYDETNAFSSCIILCLAYCLGASLNFYRPDIIAMHFPSIVSTLAVLAVSATAVLYLCYKFGETHSVDNLYEFFFGVELEPRILDINIKHWIRSRVTMGMYALFVISALYHHYNMYKTAHATVLLSTVAHLFHILCWQWCDDVQLNGIDARSSNLGFARLWSDLVLFPVLFTSPAAIVAMRRKQVSPVFAAFVVVLVAFSTVSLYVAARERLRFRRLKGNVKIGGHDPYFIMAKYRAENGDTMANLLLGSGYWGWCRHPSYLFELCTHAGFSLLAGWSGLLCHCSFFFMVAYFLIRISFDESRCLAKYGTAWAQHCQRVKCKLIPGVF